GERGRVHTDLHAHGQDDHLPGGHRLERVVAADLHADAVSHGGPPVGGAGRRGALRFGDEAQDRQVRGGRPGDGARGSAGPAMTPSTLKLEASARATGASEVPARPKSVCAGPSEPTASAAASDPDGAMRTGGSSRRSAQYATMAHSSANRRTDRSRGAQRAPPADGNRRMNGRQGGSEALLS